MNRPGHDRFWTEARRQLGDGGGHPGVVRGCCCCTVACPPRRSPPAWAAALAVGPVDPKVVAVEARRVADARAEAVVVPIAQAGSRPERPTPALGAYNGLIGTGAEEVAG
ncbi:MAG: hypothetical protein ACRD03_10910 [Acidimicrobiales bacterium]